MGSPFINLSSLSCLTLMPAAERRVSAPQPTPARQGARRRGGGARVRTSTDLLLEPAEPRVGALFARGRFAFAHPCSRASLLPPRPRASPPGTGCRVPPLRPSPLSPARVRPRRAQTGAARSRSSAPVAECRPPTPLCPTPLCHPPPAGLHRRNSPTPPPGVLAAADTSPSLPAVNSPVRGLWP